MILSLKYKPFQVCRTSDPKAHTVSGACPNEGIRKKQILVEGKQMGKRAHLKVTAYNAITVMSEENLPK